MKPILIALFYFLLLAPLAQAEKKAKFGAVSLGAIDSHNSEEKNTSGVEKYRNYGGYFFELSGDMRLFAGTYLKLGGRFGAMDGRADYERQDIEGLSLNHEKLKFSVLFGQLDLGIRIRPFSNIFFHPLVGAGVFARALNFNWDKNEYASGNQDTRGFKQEEGALGLGTYLEGGVELMFFGVGLQAIAEYRKEKTSELVTMNKKDLHHQYLVAKLGIIFRN